MSGDRWTRIAESGSWRAMRFVGWFHRRFGRAPSVTLLWLAAAYYLVRSRPARLGSLRYLRRVWASPEGRQTLGRRPGYLAVLRHLHTFAVALYDRLVVWSGELDSLAVRHDGSEKIFGLSRTGRGALLLGAHVGSIDMLSFLSRKYQLVVNVIVFHGNAARINAFLESHAPNQRIRMIDIDPLSVAAAFRIKACIERGEFVAMLADRAAPGRTARTAEATLLGDSARFPLSPFLLACVLECPVLFALCVGTGPARYETVLRPIGDGAKVPRSEREKRAGELLARYVALLEATCTRLPFQWFNFYDFWNDDAEPRA
jgi:predicted LPLAT superfamily acyltransferase